MRPRTLTPFIKPLANIFERLRAQGIMQLRRRQIPMHPPSNFDSAKSYAYHWNDQGHDIEECSIIRYKIQNLIKKKNIKVQQTPISNTYYHFTTSEIFIQGNPKKYLQDFHKRSTKHIT